MDIPGRAKTPEHFREHIEEIALDTTALPGRFRFSRISLWYLIKEE
jgi:hypothetical protein